MHSFSILDNEASAWSTQRRRRASGVGDSANLDGSLLNSDGAACRFDASATSFMFKTSSCLPGHAGSAFCSALPGRDMIVPACPGYAEQSYSAAAQCCATRSTSRQAGTSVAHIRALQRIWPVEAAQCGFGGAAMLEKAFQRPGPGPTRALSPQVNLKSLPFQGKR